MIENFTDLLKVFIQTSLIFGVLYFIFRKYIFSVFDPLAYYLMTQAFSIQLGFLEISKTGYLLNFIFCQVFFYIGFLIFAQKIKGIFIVNDTFFHLTETEYKGLSYFTLFSFLIVVIANIFLISQKGLIILSSDPSLSKLTAFESGGGLGAVRRINWSLLTLDGLCAFFLYLKTSRRRYAAIILVLILILLSGGDQGGGFNFYLYNCNIRNSFEFKKF